MAETKQIGFDFKEVAVALVRHHGLHEGKWMFGFEMSMGVGNFGATPPEAKPGALLQFVKVTLTRQPEDAPTDNALIVDAAAVNPPSRSAPKKK